jgi:hypothetical protein
VLSDSRGHCYDIATHSWLGGQHGEEETESEVSGEKGREEDKAPEEEVGSRHFTVFDFAMMSMAASNGPAVVEQR